MSQTENPFAQNTFVLKIPEAETAKVNFFSKSYLFQITSQI